MKILVVRGNPRKDGVCEKLANLFVSGMRQTDAEIFDVSLASKKIEMCRGCYACTFGDVGKCVIGDDMKGILEILDTADALVCFSPVYFYAMSAHMKNFFDRCFPFVRGYRSNAKKNGIENEMNFSKKDKKFVTISVASGRLNSSFKAMSKTYKVISDAMGFTYAADIRRSESPYFSQLGVNAVRVKRILKAYETAGKMFAQTGEIDANVIELAELEMSESDQSFENHSKIYWELSKVKKVGDFVSANLKSDVRILMSEMCKLFRPEHAPKKATIKFEFSDKKWIFLIKISDGKCAVSKIDNPDEPADLSVKTDSISWADFLAKRVDALKLLASKKIMLEGDKSLFSGMKKFFVLSGK